MKHGNPCGVAVHEDLTAAYSNRIDRVYYSLSGGKQKYDGFRTNSDLDQWKAAGKVGYDINADSNLELSVDSLGKELGVPLATGSLCKQRPDQQASNYCHECHSVQR